MFMFHHKENLLRKENGLQLLRRMEMCSSGVGLLWLRASWAEQQNPSVAVV